MTQILKEVNVDLSSIKLVKCLAVHNEEDWVEFNLRNNYDEFDIIRVVEGAVEGRPNSTHDGHSTDRTLELVKNFPDPDNKIQLITLGRSFKSLEEQKQLFLEFASEGEWLFIVDCDEFYMEGDISRVRNAIKKHPMASEFIPLFLHFYRDFTHVKAPHPEWQIQHQRIFRYREGMRYHTHPVVTDAQGKCTYFTPEYQTMRYTLPIYIYHYGHAKGVEHHKMKQEFYKKELENFGVAVAAFDQKLEEFVNHSEDLDTILEFDGEHPEAIRSHPSFSFRDSHYVNTEDDKLGYSTIDIKNWKEDVIYSKDKLPTIALWMLPEFQQRMSTLYNEVRV